jgi:pimeloyl-ACP methyl ester carboxylesterase
MFLQIGDVRLHTLVFGDGPRTLLAVGGWTGSWEVWEEPIAQLSTRGWRCVTYDHRGSGESPVDPASISVDAMASDVTAVMDALGIDRCIVAGESQGGAIVQYAAERHPDRFEGLVLSAPAPTGRQPGRSAFAASCRDDYVTATRNFVEACTPEANSEHIKRWGQNILARANAEEAARILEMWADEDVTGVDATQIRVPTLIIHGTADAIAPIEGSRALVEQLPDATLVELEGVGHVPTMTRPDDVVAAIVKRFG